MGRPLRTVGDNTQSKCNDIRFRIGFGRTVYQYARKFRDLGDPPTIFFSIKKNGE